MHIATECRDLNPQLSNKAIHTSKMYCDTLAMQWRDEQWDMADETLKRLAEPAFSIGRNCPGARDIYLIISNTLGYHVTGESFDHISRLANLQRRRGTISMSPIILASSTMGLTFRFGRWTASRGLAFESWLSKLDA